MQLTIKALESELVWVHLAYPDKSEFSFQTTLCPAILNAREVVLEPGKLVRLDKKYYIDGLMVYKQFDPADAQVTIWSEEHYRSKAAKEFSRYL